jgi:hypothetical protein
VRFGDIPSTYTRSENNLGILLAEVKKITIEKYTNNKTANFKLLESNMTTIDGKPASKLVFLATLTDNELKYMSLVTIKNNRRYDFDFAADVEQYNSYAPTFQKMVNSVKIR